MILFFFFFIQENNTSGLTTPVKLTPDTTPQNKTPFSPSQFLKSPQQLSFEALTSTPVMGTLPPLSLLTPNQPTPQASDPPNDGSQSLNTPTPAFPVPANGLSLKTPKSRRVLIHPTPKTPTPLKNALKEIERKIEALKQMVSERVFFSDWKLSISDIVASELE